MEEQVELMHKLYRARRGARSLYGDKYFERIKPYQDAIIEGLPLFENNHLLVALSLASRLKETDASEMSVLLLLAAAVEMLEPTKP